MASASAKILIDIDVPKITRKVKKAWNHSKIQEHGLADNEMLLLNE